MMIETWAQQTQQQTMKHGRNKVLLGLYQSDDRNIMDDQNCQNNSNYELPEGRSDVRHQKLTEKLIERDLT